jgi:hypothetical protein
MNVSAMYATLEISILLYLNDRQPIKVEYRPL